MVEPAFCVVVNGTRLLASSVAGTMDSILVEMMGRVMNGMGMKLTVLLWGWMTILPSGAIAGVDACPEFEKRPRLNGINGQDSGSARTDSSITQYSKISALITTGNQTMIAMRKFFRNGTAHYLCVDPQSLATFIWSPEGNASWNVNEIQEIPVKTTYGQALKFAANLGTSLQDAGIKHFPDSRNYVLSTDLCPSEKPLDYRLYNAIRNDMGQPHPIPLCICVSGRWIQTHSAALEWLKGISKQGFLDITWINHSYYHHYRKDLPLSADFLLMKGTHIREEILLNEQLMIENGIVPSVFFRFPGLISDLPIYQEVVAYGLIPIGSDAWLAKGETLRPGSVVLLHGNCNEPLGVREFITFLRREVQKPENREMKIASIFSEFANMLK